ncbi:MAG: hypothetical protein ACK4MV_10100 [Beijerinckiaceae bacterium]
MDIGVTGSGKRSGTALAKREEKMSPEQHALKARIFAHALLELARNRIPYDFFVSKAIWGLSLYLETGEFRQENFNRYARLSVAAKQLHSRTSIGEWKRTVRFEHCMPLRAIWQGLLDCGPELDLQKLLGIIGAYPPIIITREEDDRIDKKWKASGAPEDRYEGIALTCELKSDRYVENARRIMSLPQSLASAG